MDQDMIFNQERLALQLGLNLDSTMTTQDMP